MTASGTLVLVPDMIGDSVISLPALQAFDLGSPPAPVTAVTPSVIVELLETQLPHWQWLALENWADDAQQPWELAVDFAGMDWSTKVMREIRAGRRIGPDVGQDHSCFASYDEVVCLPQWTPTTQATEAFNPIVRHVAPHVNISHVPSLRQHSGDTASLHIPTVALVPGAGCRGKRWPLGSFLRLARSMKETGVKIVWFLGPKEDDIHRTLSAHEDVILHKRPIKEVVAELAGASVVVANDTGLMHIAAALGRPTLGIFGASVPTQWFPYEHPSGFIQHPDAGKENGVIVPADQDYKFWPEPWEVENWARDRLKSCSTYRQ